MSPVKSSFAILVVLASASFGCGSSSSNNTKPDTNKTPDASTMTSGDDGGGSGNPLGNLQATCGLLANVSGGSSSSCGSGMTCCTVLAFPPSASCVAVGGCASGNISNECTSGTDCSGGQLCCAGSADGGAADAAAGGGIIPGFDPTMLSTACQSSCTGTQAQTCAMDSDCPTGLTCQSPFAGAGGGGLGSTITGLLGGGGAALPSVCAMPLPDAGKAPADSGSTVPEASTPDAGDTTDAGQGGD
jgi:hypothetical protein